MGRSKGYSAPDLFMSCEECGRLLVETPSGYLACPVLGHGKLRIAEPPPVPTEPGESVAWADTCRHCGWELDNGQVDSGALYCGRCSGVLERHAKAAGIGG